MAIDEEHIEHLEHRLVALRELCSESGNTEDVAELLLIIRRPGFTTPRELFFLNTLIDAIEHSLAQVRTLRKELLGGAADIVETAAE